jgi:diguanylate cyclase (GGDEF)-like protein
MSNIVNISLAGYAKLSDKNTIKESIDLIRSSESGLGVFTNGLKPKAVLSESDVIRALAVENSIHTLAYPFSTENPIVINENRSKEYALKLMISSNVKRVPVCGDSGDIVGILTQDILLKELDIDSQIKPLSAINIIGARKAILGESEDSVETILNLMSKYKIGMIPLLENGKAVGVLTESDILMCSSNSSLKTTKAKDIMRSPIKGVDELATIDSIIESFEKDGVKHLVVFSRDGRIIGVISKRDVLKHLQQNYLSLVEQKDLNTKNTLNTFVYPLLEVSKSNDELIIKWSNSATIELFKSSLIDTPLKDIFDEKLYSVVIEQKSGSSFFKKNGFVFDVKCSTIDGDDFLIAMYDITDTYNLKEHIQSIIDVMPDLVVVTDGVNMTGANNSLLNFFGYDNFEEFRDDHSCICEKFVSDIGYLEGDSEGEWLKEVFKNGEENKKSYAKIVRKDDDERIFEVKANMIQDKNISVLIFSDVTENEKYKKLLQNNNSILEEEIQRRTWELMEANDEVSRNRQMLEEANKVAKILNWIYFTKLEVFEFYGDLEDVIPLDTKIVKADKLSEFFEKRDIDELIAKIKNATKDAQNFSALLETKNEYGGKDVRFRGKPYHIEDGSIISYFGTMQDISEERELEKRASYDELTGIYNRRKFNEISNYEFNRFQRSGHSFALILFDIDKFKSVNDTYGHDIGDVVLKDIAKLVSSQLRDIDMFARWGGEEFVILIQDQSAKDAAFVAEKLRGSIEEHKFLDLPTITCSFGVAQIGEKGLEDLFKRADVALYRAKTNGRNQVFSM